MKNLLLAVAVLLTVSLHSQTLYYPDKSGDDWQATTPDELGWCADQLPPLLDYLEASDTKAFILLKSGKIAVEVYQNGHSQDSVWYWASAGKSLTAFELGLLEQDGAIDFDNPTREYLGPGWTSCDTMSEAAITVRHQMTMTSGLDYEVPDVNCIAPECLTCLNPPDTEWYYHNAPYSLLHNVIEEVSGRSRTLHTFLILGNRIGLRGAWVDLGDGTKTFFSTARTMARFGLLMNGKGVWDGDALLSDEDYYTTMTTSSQPINRSYGYLWWLNSGPTFRLPGSTITFPGKIIPSASDNVYMALGKNSQMIVIDPDRDIVMVRMGNDPDPSAVPVEFMRGLWDRVEAVMCTPTSTHVPSQADMVIIPSGNNAITVQSAAHIESVTILDASGRQLRSASGTTISTSHLEAGVYIIRIVSDKGVAAQQWLKRY